MKIITLELGMLQTNCYILINKNKALVIDPAAEYEKIKSVIKDYEVEGILLTHRHFDHIGALNELKKEYNLNENDFNNIKSFDFEVISTPGHTSDSQTFYFKEENIMFTGDFVFYHNIGRTDLPTGDSTAMQKSLKILKEYPNDIQIFPGHGPSSILRDEKKLFDYYF